MLADADFVEAARVLAVLGLQSDLYRDDPEFRDAVDDVLTCVRSAGQFVWDCKVCGMRGQMTWQPGVTLQEQIAVALAAHRQAQPQCPAPERGDIHFGEEGV